ncbi:hypothetical protein [Brevundimonas bullata]
MTDQNNAPSSSASDVATVQEWIKRTRLSYKSHGPADAMERILIRTTVTAATLRSLLDNLVIAQGLSREIRTQATAEARSYLFNTRQAAPAPSSLAGGEVMNDDAPTYMRLAQALSRHPEVMVVERSDPTLELTPDSLEHLLEDVFPLAALSPEAPARDGVDAVLASRVAATMAALTPRHEAPASEGEV